jgi:hypothetical protein
MIQLGRVSRTTLWTRHARSERLEPSKGAVPAPEEAPVEEPKIEAKEVEKLEAPKEGESEKPAKKAKKAKKVKKAALSEEKQKTEG